MTNPTWTWADLSSEQQRLMAEAEQALGVDFLLAYEPSDDPDGDGITPIGGLTAATLSESQLECLGGLEAQLNSVVVAYRKGDA